MKRRRIKHAENRQIREAFRTSKRDLGDVRRWGWMVDPESFREPGDERTGLKPFRFDPKWGRTWVWEPKDGSEEEKPENNREEDQGQR